MRAETISYLKRHASPKVARHYQNDHSEEAIQYLAAASGS